MARRPVITTGLPQSSLRELCQSLNSPTVLPNIKSAQTQPSTIVGPVRSISMSAPAATIAHRPQSTVPSTEATSPLRLLKIPPEVRNNIYKYIFTPTSSADIHTTTHDISLSLTWVYEGSPVNEILKRKPGLYYSRPSNYKFLSTSKQIYHEALPILARHSSLRLSGTPFHHLQFLINTGKFPLLSELCHAICLYTTHLILDQPVIRPDPALADALVSGILFPRLNQLTVYTAGPATMSYATPEWALSSSEATSLATTKQWPQRLTEIAPALQFHPVWLHRYFHTPPHDGLSHIQTVLEDLRARLGSAHTSSSKSPNLVIHVVQRLPLWDTITSTTPVTHTVFEAVQVAVDFDTHQIQDVSFYKLHKDRSKAHLWPKQYRSFWASPWGRGRGLAS
ncbi:hypothetical protein PMZ80_001706 [Knufia obscura]|uniref:Uncharacterized protein n=2 Tax=Knufia TaxID=430999 RepID=A0AAN8ETH6_9EURO|nr:hypothetical protein PMZ80_001706 [Knufia obscura]KAK5955470.1 hypothetical protein OHC33_003108 [Knufia fluminis]